jgi:hypothetical protein
VQADAEAPGDDLDVLDVEVLSGVGRRVVVLSWALVMLSRPTEHAVVGIADGDLLLSRGVGAD